MYMYVFTSMFIWHVYVCVCTKTIMFMGQHQTPRNEPNWAGQSTSPTSGCSIASSFAPHIRNFVTVI